MIDKHSLPVRLSGLSDLANNLWWTWSKPAQRLFNRVDPALWKISGRNPILLLSNLPRERLEELGQDEDFLAAYDTVLAAFQTYMQDEDSVICARSFPDLVDETIAYLSMEFGLHEILPIYAGGLGVLSGDHLKEASDLGLPVVGLGLLYRQGYFKQEIDQDGRQGVSYGELELSALPIAPVLDADGYPMTVQLDLAGRELAVGVWKIQIGRTPLYLLDTDLETNRPEDRAITARLYPSDLDLRISQEIILGIGGVRALRRLGIQPTVWHMNEGHPAFSALERIREGVGEGSMYSSASSVVHETTVFTTHTPVAAGHDRFPVELIDRYFSSYWSQLSLGRDSFLALGIDHQPDYFSMSTLALRLSGRLNGVSQLHGETTRRMWSFFWPDRNVEAVPIGHVTNGIHTPSWLGEQLEDLYDRYLESDWRECVEQPDAWEKLESVPMLEIWQAHLSQKRLLLDQLATRAQAIIERRGLNSDHLAVFGGHLNFDALTIGFARRFTAYKRPTLIFSQMDRLVALLNRGVQIIFAGKAHPNDEQGAALLRQVFQIARRPDCAGRIVLLENYDLELGRLLVQGVDLWLNTPRPPNEASGTSGQKAALNGVLNCSTWDGWWPEGYNGRNGWLIGEETVAENFEVQDRDDAESLFRVLEEEIIPLFYRRTAKDAIPEEWVARMKDSIVTLGPRFSARRMLREYVAQLYVP